MTTRHGPYDDAVAYDLLHARGTAAEAAGLLRIARRVLGPRAALGTWLEPACGTGRLMIALASRGVRQVVGVDLDPGMVDLARVRIAAAGQSRRVRVLHGDMRTLDRLVGGARFDGAFCTDNSIRHLPTDTAMIDHLRAVARVLRSGGIYIVGIGLTPVGGGFAGEDVRSARRGRVCVHQVLDFLPPPDGAAGRSARMESVIGRVEVRTGADVRERLVSYGLRTYTLDQWHGVVRRAGMNEVAVMDLHARPLGHDRTGYAMRLLAPVNPGTAISAPRVSARKNPRLSPAPRPDQPRLRVRRRER